jgi:hypothetical protein
MKCGTLHSLSGESLSFRTLVRKVLLLEESGPASEGGLQAEASCSAHYKVRLQIYRVGKL